MRNECPEPAIIYLLGVRVPCIANFRLLIELYNDLYGKAKDCSCGGIRRWKNECGIFEKIEPAIFCEVVTNCVIHRPM